MNYKPSGKEPESIIPFSLDGLPMAPKLLNQKIDDWYVPTDEELRQYEEILREKLQAGEDLESTNFLIETISPIATRIFLDLAEKTRAHSHASSVIQKLVELWLNDEGFEDFLICSKAIPAKEMMEDFLKMATDTGKVSLDFCIGHVWRHCQPTMYKLLSFAQLSNGLIAEIVALDERLKRYSYGPPVDSLQQLMALQKHGILKLGVVNDPQIELTETGWNLTKDNHKFTASCMVNAVLDSPQILKVTESLPHQLLRDSELKPLHSELGVETLQDSIVKADSDSKNLIALHGRLAKGTLIGVDAIAECFGERSEHWAEGVVERFHP